MNEKDIEYIEIDVIGLANCLATDEWKETVKGEREDDLYEMVAIEENGQIILKRQIRPEHATTFFQIRKCYIELIKQYAKDYDPLEELQPVIIYNCISCNSRLTDNEMGLGYIKCFTCQMSDAN